MSTIPSHDKPEVRYARLYGSLAGYSVRVEPHQLFIDTDSHVYLLTPEQAQALTLLGAVVGIEQANVLAALARVGEVHDG